MSSSIHSRTQPTVSKATCRHLVSSIFYLLFLFPTLVCPAKEQQSSSRRRLQVKLPPPATDQQQQQVVSELGFQAFDSNHNGVIDYDEYKRGLKKLAYFLEVTPNEMFNSPVSSSSSFFSRIFGGPDKSSVTSATGGNIEEDEDLTHIWPAFFHSCTMIVATEVGDKTFFIAAVLSMKNDRLPVLLGALSALYCMTALSVMMGMILPNLLPRQYTSLFGGLLFLYFGVKLLKDSRSMHDGVSDELEEVEEELLGIHPKKKHDIESGDENENSGGGNAEHSGNAATRKNSSMGPQGDVSWEKVLVQSLTLTFLAEWGDRSQIATIALAAHKEPYGVTLGGCLGHTLCTSVAVMGGRILASKISEKSVAVSGGLIFLVFGLHSIFFD